MPYPDLLIWEPTEPAGLLETNGFASLVGSNMSKSASLCIISHEISKLCELLTDLLILEPTEPASSLLFNDLAGYVGDFNELAGSVGSKVSKSGRSFAKR